MEQRISMVTLGVADLSRARAFYEAMGWRGQQVQETVFFQAGGMVLVLWSADALAQDAGGGPLVEGFRGTALAQNVRSEVEVDAVLEAAAAAGGTVTRAPATTSYGGYAGYCCDPDGHAWEIAYNPGFPLADDGTITVPDLGAG